MRSRRDRTYEAKGAARAESLRGGKQLASGNAQHVTKRALRVLHRSDLTELR